MHTSVYSFVDCDIFFSMWVKFGERMTVFTESPHKLFNVKKVSYAYNNKSSQMKLIRGFSEIRNSLFLLDY